MRARPATVEWLRSFYAAVDGLCFEELGEYLHPDCESQYPTGLTVRGREKILRGMSAALGALAGITHELKAAWEEDEELIFELEVTYRRRDGQTIMRPGLGIFVLRDGRVLRQRLFVDAAGVWD